MMQAMITTANGVFEFSDNHATAAISAVRAHKMIDGMATAEGASDAVRTQIPYSSVVMAQFMYAPDDTEVEDDNCKVKTPADVEPEPEPEPDPEPEPEPDPEPDPDPDTPTT